MVRQVLGALLAASAFSPAAFAFEITSDEWTFSANGNVNAHYIYARCEKDGTPAVVGGLACRGAAGEDRSSSVSNGLLPAALVLGASTTQKGFDLSVTFGFYPGISTNDGSPNLQQGAELLNTALGTTGLDIRQVFLTFGNKQMGEFMLGRNIGLFQSDVILNDMSLIGVGAGNGNYAAPANTALGSIGLGYIYADWFAQINYTTPDFGGLKITVGVYDPLEPIIQAPPPIPESAPGFHGKISYTREPVYLSASFIGQKNEGATEATDFDSFGFDVGGRVRFAGAELLGWYYHARGVGTTALFFFSDDRLGHERDSHGFLAQLTYKLGDTKLGVNYGESDLDLASGELPSFLVKSNRKFTVGVYHSLTQSLTLLAEYTDVRSKAHNGQKNDSSNFNVGAFLSF